MLKYCCNGYMYFKKQHNRSMALLFLALKKSKSLSFKLKKIHKYSMFDKYKYMYMYLVNSDWCLVYLWPLASRYDRERGFWRSHEPVVHYSEQHPTDAGQKTQNSLPHRDYSGTPLSLLPEISIKIIILILYFRMYQDPTW